MMKFLQKHETPVTLAIVNCCSFDNCYFLRAVVNCELASAIDSSLMVRKTQLVSCYLNNKFYWLK